MRSDLNQLNSIQKHNFIFLITNPALTHLLVANGAVHSEREDVQLLLLRLSLYLQVLTGELVLPARMCLEKYLARYAQYGLQPVPLTEAFSILISMPM
jgi:hypothetical protein